MKKKEGSALTDLLRAPKRGSRLENDKFSSYPTVGNYLLKTHITYDKIATFDFDILNLRQGYRTSFTRFADVLLENKLIYG